MPFVIPPGRNQIVAAAFVGLKADDRRMKRIASMTKAKPAPEPEPKKNAKPVRAKTGKTRRKP
jgi:hypothetical protein